jgi:hypothetical protein
MGRGGDHRLGLPVLHAQRTERHSAQGEPGATQLLRAGFPQPVLHPDYVVRFLTDNTLGRTWYEMRQGNTRLTGQCEYLVRRPDEVFLAEAPFPEIAEAQRWLQGEDVPEPDVVSLSHTV